MASGGSSTKRQNNWKFRFRSSQQQPQIVDPTQPRVNVRFNPARDGSCPYRAWRNYFPMEEYFSGSSTESTVKILETYMKDHFSKCDSDIILHSESISIDYKEIVSHEIVKSLLPSFAKDVITSPDHMLSCLGLAAHQTAMGACQSAEKEQAKDGVASSALHDDIPVIRARIHNVEPLTPLKHLKARSCGTFVAVRGTIVKVSNIKPLCTTMAFRCNACGHIQALLLIDNMYVTPTSCDGPSCGSRGFTPVRDHPLTEITDWQIVKLQENLSDTHREAGRMPRTVEIELSRDLTDTASPGDVVTITGIVKTKKADETGYFGKARDKYMYLIYLEGNHVSNSRRMNTQDCRSINAETELDFSEKDLLGIDKIQKEDDIFSLLVASLCPAIYGQEMVKAGMLLALFGGDQTKTKEDNDRIPIRADSHVLIVGDPGLGKSQMLQAASRLAPRGVYVCGTTSSTSGLTVTLSRDASGDTALEAGALVLADQGVCCIDEFDKMGGQQQALLEAMEQQTISIAKAGVVCNMPARCSILAAANPVGGHYNKAKTVSENLHMGGALLSRFDLVFVLLDTPDEAKDKMLSDHVMAMHSGHLDKSASSSDKKFIGEASSKTFRSALEKRLALFSRQENDPVPHALAWKYIAYARKNVQDISLSEEACQVLKEFYLELRKQGYKGDSTPITTRQLESMKRLSEARAKVEMTNTVSAEHARDVVEIMRHSLYDTFSDEADSLVFTRSLHGSGVSKRGAAKKMIAALHQAASSNGTNIFSLSEMRNIAKGLNIDGSKCTNIIESLNDQGYLLHKGNSSYKLQTI